jgi:hypothetical protein
MKKRKSVLFLLASLVFWQCSDDTTNGALPDSGQKKDVPTVFDGKALPEAGAKESGALNESGAPLTDGTSGGEARPSDSWGPTNQPMCNNTIFACSDGLDNDQDGLIDAMDPECVGPCDNDEASYATGIPGDNADPCKQDCFFDGDSGQGQEKCIWDLKCDPANPGAKLGKCEYDPNFDKCDTSKLADCRQQCLGLTPNGCDCFGCCQIFANNQSYAVFLGSGPTCSTQTPENCIACTPVQDCLNPCEECELCLGKTMADLPATCFPAKPDGGAAVGDGGSIADAGPFLPFCSPGVTPCLTNNDCPDFYYCTTGCCIHGID